MWRHSLLLLSSALSRARKRQAREPTQDGQVPFVSSHIAISCKNLPVLGAKKCIHEACRHTHSRTHARTRTHLPVLGAEEGIYESNSFARRQPLALDIIELVFQAACVEKLTDFACVCARVGVRVRASR